MAGNTNETVSFKTKYTFWQTTNIRKKKTTWVVNAIPPNPQRQMTWVNNKLVKTSSCWVAGQPSGYSIPPIAFTVSPSPHTHTHPLAPRALVWQPFIAPNFRPAGRCVDYRVALTVSLGNSPQDTAA